MLRVSSAAVVPASAIKLIQKKVNVLVAAHVYCRDEVTDGANQQTSNHSSKNQAHDKRPRALAERVEYRKPLHAVQHLQICEDDKA
jgi:hypothetical protein